MSPYYNDVARQAEKTKNYGYLFHDSGRSRFRGKLIAKSGVQLRKLSIAPTVKTSTVISL
jgi:hypothetical protein